MIASPTTSEFESFRGTCQREFEEIHRKLDRLDEALRGTPGNGHPGMKVRLDRLEQAQAVRSKLMWIITGSVVSMTVATFWKLFLGA